MFCSREASISIILPPFYDRRISSHSYSKPTIHGSFTTYFQSRLLPLPAGMPHSLRQRRRSPFLSSNAVPRSPHHASPLAMLHPAMVLGTPQGSPSAWAAPGTMVPPDSFFFSISQQQSFADLLFDTIESLAPLHMYILGQCTGLFAFPCSCPLPPIPSPTGFDGRVLS